MTIGVAPNDIFHNGDWYNRDGAPVSGAGFAPNVTLTPTLLTDCILGQLPDGRFVGFGDNDSSGDVRLWISTAYVGGTITRVNSSQASAGGGLKDTLGASIVGANAGIVNGWCVSNGDIIMMVQAHAAARYHLFRLKANSNASGTTNSCGSDANYSNGQAILDIGLLGGTQPVGIRGLAGHSFLEATINGVKVYFFVEYNVAAGRVDGSTSDQVRAWKSTDSGATWSAVLTFNTDGSTHQVDHFHAVVQDPYTGWIYFLTGDNGAENAVIAWDGVSAAPAANASLATIAATAGWKVTSGDELRRYTDLCFGPAGIYSIPDADTEAAESTTTAFVGVTLPRTLDYVSTIAPAPRLSNIPPILAVRHPSGWAAMASFRTTGAPEQYLHIWLQDDPNGYLAWRLANKIKNYITATGTPAQFFIGTDGALYLSGKYGQGIQFSSVVKSGTTIRFTVSNSPSPTLVFDGA